MDRQSWVHLWRSNGWFTYWGRNILSGRRLKAGLSLWTHVVDTGTCSAAKCRLAQGLFTVSGLCLLPLCISILLTGHWIYKGQFLKVKNHNSLFLTTSSKIWKEKVPSRYHSWSSISMGSAPTNSTDLWSKLFDKAYLKKCNNENNTNVKTVQCNNYLHSIYITRYN